MALIACRSTINDVRPTENTLCLPNMNSPAVGVQGESEIQVSLFPGDIQLQFLCMVFSAPLQSEFVFS